MRVGPRTVREFFEEEDPDAGPGLVHVVRGTGREDNDPVYYTACNVTLIADHGKLSVRCELPTCLVCASGTKRCLRCGGSVLPARFPTDVAERCVGCAL